MVHAPAGYRPNSYHWAQREGQPKEHCAGNSYDNLVALEGPLVQQQVLQPRVQQPAAPVPKPGRSEPSGAGAGSLLSSPDSSASLDQFAPMLPSHPVQQLPALLPGTCTSATVRVAAWLLGDHGAEGGAAAPRSEASCHCDSGDDCADLALLDLQAAAAAHAPSSCAGAGEDCEGYRATANYSTDRACFDGFMSAPVQHGDELNNYVAALY